jgi:hypothetical protein
MSFEDVNATYDSVRDATPVVAAILKGLVDRSPAFKSISATPIVKGDLNHLWANTKVHDAFPGQTSSDSRDWNQVAVTLHMIHLYWMPYMLSAVALPSIRLLPVHPYIRRPLCYQRVALFGASLTTITASLLQCSLED